MRASRSSEAGTPVSVDRAALCAVMDAVGLGEMSSVLAPLAEWVPPTERGPALDKAWAEVARAGLATGEQGLDDDTWAWLRVLSAPAEERYAWTSSPGAYALTVLAASRGDQALLAVLGDDEQLRLLRIEADQLDDALVAAVPECLPGAKTLRLAYGQAEDNDVFDQQAEFEMFAARPPAALTELYVACTPHLGRRRVVETPMWLRDTSQGRYLMRMTRTEAITDPGSNRAVVAALREARRGLTR